VKKKRKITNKEYQNEFLVSRQTASRDLAGLTDKDLFELKGTGKRDTHYTHNEAKIKEEMSVKNVGKMSVKKSE
jgi:predicted HTH transcriptional regulator